MGAPRRNRKKYDRPKDIHNLVRIEADNAIIKEYGLKNMRELWKVQSDLSGLRGNIRDLLAGAHGKEGVEKSILDRLYNIGVAEKGSTLDRLLDISERDLLERRLQSRVFRKGLSRSIKTGEAA
ncbi:30S ribosomal protein S4P, partial [mine drainage metagenome]